MLEGSEGDSPKVAATSLRINSLVLTKNTFTPIIYKETPGREVLKYEERN